MDEQHQFKAFCVIVAAICYLTTLALIAAWDGHAIEGVGVASAVAGLLALAKFPAQKSVTVDNPPSNPVPTVDPQSGDK